MLKYVIGILFLLLPSLSFQFVPGKHSLCPLLSSEQLQRFAFTLNSLILNLLKDIFSIGCQAFNMQERLH